MVFWFIAKYFAGCNKARLYDEYQGYKQLSISFKSHQMDDI